MTLLTKYWTILLFLTMVASGVVVAYNVRRFCEGASGYLFWLFCQNWCCPQSAGQRIAPQQNRLALRVVLQAVASTNVATKNKKKENKNFREGCVGFFLI